MATKKSSLLTNVPAPTTAAFSPTNSANDGGRVRTKNGSVALAAGDLDLDDVVMLCGVPTNATILSIRLAADDLDSGTGTLTWNLGIYRKADDTAENGDEDVYATLIALGAAATAFTEYAFEARGIEKAGQKVWEDAGDTADPNGTYYVGLNVSAAPNVAAAGDLAFIVEYAVD